jgi:hypothetical protein
VLQLWCVAGVCGPVVGPHQGVTRLRACKACGVYHTPCFMWPFPDEREQLNTMTRAEHEPCAFNACTHSSLVHDVQCAPHIGRAYEWTNAKLRS